MNLISALPGNSSVNTNRGNNRRETVFSMRSASGKSALPGNAAGNMHPQQLKTVFSVGFVQRSYLKNKRRYDSVLSSEKEVPYQNT
jgi:hypothetical protein